MAAARPETGNEAGHSQQGGILAALPGGDNALGWGRRYGLYDYSGKPPDSMIDAYLRGYDELPASLPRIQRAIVLSVVARRPAHSRRPR
jgi:hypothetical protein